MTLTVGEFLWIFTRNLLMTSWATVFYGVRQRWRRMFYDDFQRFRIRLTAGQKQRNLYAPQLLVLIHGRNGHPADFEPLVEYLNDQSVNYDLIVSLHLHNNAYSTLEEDCEEIHSQLCRYCAGGADHRNIDSPEVLKKYEITLIGLSKGGLGACMYAAQNRDLCIKKIITIVSPLLGTMVASYHWSKKVRDVLGLKKISSFPVLHDKIRYFHITTVYDHLVIPETSGRFIFTSEENTFICQSTVGHIGVIYDHTVQRKIKQWLLK